MNGGGDALGEFLAESAENLERMDRELVALEECPDDSDALSGVFRTIHTLKGTAGFFGLPKLEELTHIGESLLDAVREGVRPLDRAATSALLEMVDAVREILGWIESSHDEGEGDYTHIAARLTRLVEGQPEEDEAPAAEALAVEVAAKAAPKPAAARTTAAARAPAAADSGVRVDSATLDNLMTLAGELVLARNQMLQHAARFADSTFADSCHRLSQITAALQDEVIRTRMQPIDHALRRLPRVVRDLAILCGKRARIDAEGGETTLDRSVLEAIRESLTHIVRNAVDHGIETPGKRRAAGKPEEGRLRVRAFHESGRMHIEVSDDGGGIDPVRVERRAIECGLISAAEAAQLSESDRFALIFVPGFSTARQITSVSGRGVGMDAVKTSIERIGGTVEVSSRLGQGTTIRIKIPLTLAIVPALMVTSGGERFCIPQVHVRELVRPSVVSDGAIELFHSAPVYRLRSRLIPIVYAREVLGQSAPTPDSPTIVILEVGNRAFGLVVDDVLDTQDIVVKPLGRHLQSLSLFAGATILGDGQVALILDASGVADAARVGTAANDDGAPVILGDSVVTHIVDMHALLAAAGR